MMLLFIALHMYLLFLLSDCEFLEAESHCFSFFASPASLGAGLPGDELTEGL